MKLLMIGLLLLSSAGCSSDKDMREKFGDSLPHFFTENKTGDIYIITHNFGDNYFVKYWPNKEQIKVSCKY